jgi:hypothetical protein
MHLTVVDCSTLIVIFFEFQYPVWIWIWSYSDLQANLR